MPHTVSTLMLPPMVSVCNGSAIITQHGLSNAKPLIVDLILPTPETKF